MSDDVYAPFDRDVEAHGAYVYTGLSRASAVRANRRFTEVVLAATDYVGRRVVDVGCGDGTYTATLAERSGAREVVGVDPAALAIARARRVYGGSIPSLRFEHGLPAELLERGEHFDVAVYRGVIHHVGDPAHEIAVALALAAEVFFLEPNGYNPLLKLLERTASYHRSHEERSFGLTRYRQWIAAAGGRTRRTFFFGLVPMFCPAWLAAVAGRLEPVVEQVPGLRTITCGQVGILAGSAQSVRSS